MLCLSIFHGRNTPDEVMEDWGFFGPIIENVGFALTYNTLKVFEIQHDGSFGDMVILPRHEDMITLDGKFYADVEVLLPTDPIVSDETREHLTFHQLKAIIEKGA